LPKRARAMAEETQKQEHKLIILRKLCRHFASLSTVHVLHFLMVLHTAWNFFFGAGQTNGWGQFSCFCLTVECDFYAFLCANEKKQAKFSIKRIHIILCRWCSATIKISSLSPSHSLKLYILFFYDNELNFCRFSR
jgi:hypothetical protein